MDEEEQQVDSAELLELVSGLRDKAAADEDQPDNGEYRKGENCLYFAKAIMRTLRREQRAGGFSAMSQLVRWEIPKSDLVPLVLQYRRDKALCRSLIKIMVALTLPVTRVFAGVQDHLEKLQNCKELFVTSGDLVAVLMGFLAEPLAREDRTKEDVSTMDALLNLFHNLLHIRCPTNPMLDDMLLKLFFRENVMDALVVVAQSVDTEANRAWAMLLTNTFHLITDGLVPEDLCFAHYSSVALQQKGGGAMVKAIEAEATSRLRAIRSKEKKVAKEEKFRLSGPRQGGAFITKEDDGSKKVVQAAHLLLPLRGAPKIKPRTRVAPPWDRVDRTASKEVKAELFAFLERFVTSNVFSVLMYEAAAAISRSDLEEAFLPSFQADVNRYIRLVAWFVRFDYVRQVQAMRVAEDPHDVRREHPILDKVPKRPANQTFTLEHIEAVLNPSTVDFLFQRAEHSLTQKPVAYRDVHIIFRALGEFLNTCGYILCNGSMQLRYEAKKTLFKIFLDRRNFLDRLPHLLQTVVLSKMPKHYLVSLVNTVDLTFIVLEKIEEIDRGIVVLKKKKNRGGSSVTNRKDDEHEHEEQERLDQENPDRPEAEQEDLVPFNDFEALQTQDFRLVDYIRKFQHNKVIEICSVLLDECSTNTDELNTSIWRLFERIRTGSGDPNVALPAIFCQARVLSIFARLMTERREGEMRETLRDLADFGEHIVQELMRLTADGLNAHIFASLLFWRSLRENQDFEGINMRLAMEDAELRRRHGSDDEDDEEGGSELDRYENDEVVLADDDILMDPEAIAESIRQDEERRKLAKELKLKNKVPRKPRTALQLFVAEERARQPEKSTAQVKVECKAAWDAASAELKAVFNVKAREDRARYEREMEEYIPSDDDDQGAERAKRLKKRDIMAAQQEVVDKLASVAAARAGDDGKKEESSSEDIPISVIYAERVRLQQRRQAAATPKKKAQPKKTKKNTTPRKRDVESDSDPEDSDHDGVGEDEPPYPSEGTPVKRAKSVSMEEHGRVFTHGEDVSLREKFVEFKGREPHEVPRLLHMHADWEAEITLEQIAHRLHSLQCIDKEQMTLMLGKSE